MRKSTDALTRADDDRRPSPAAARGIDRAAVGGTGVAADGAAALSTIATSEGDEGGASWGGGRNRAAGDGEDDDGEEGGVHCGR